MKALAGRAFGALTEDGLRGFEGLIRHDWLMRAGELLLLPAEATDVHRISDYVEHGLAIEFLALVRAKALLVQSLGDRAGAVSARGVQVEDLSHDHSFVLVDQQPGLGFESIADGHAAAGPFTHLGHFQHAALDAVDDDAVFVFSDCTLDLEDQSPRKRIVVDILARAQVDDTQSLQLVSQEGQLATLSGEPVNGQKRDMGEQAGACVGEHLLQAGAIHVRAAGGVFVDAVLGPFVAEFLIAQQLKCIDLRAKTVFLHIIGVCAFANVPRHEWPGGGSR